MGDFNARTKGEQASILCCKEDCDPIWFTEESNHQWDRILEDKAAISLENNCLRYVGLSI